MSPLEIFRKFYWKSERLPVNPLTHLVSIIAMGWSVSKLWSVGVHLHVRLKEFQVFSTAVYRSVEMTMERITFEWIHQVFNHIGSVIILDVKWIKCCTRKAGKDLFWLVFLYIIHKYNFLVWHYLIFDRSHGSEPSVVMVWRPLFVWWTHPERPYIRSRLTIWFLQYYVWSGSDGSWLMKASLRLVDTPWETVVHHRFFSLWVGWTIEFNCMFT